MPFTTYFEEHIRSRVMMSFSGYLESLGLSEEIITTNISESQYAVFHCTQNWNEVTPDVLLMTTSKL